MLIIFAVGLLFLSQQNKKENSSIPQNEISKDVTAKNSSSYISYSERAYDNAINKKRVLFFYANWCPICRPVDKELSETNKIPDNVVIFRVNFNDSDTDNEERGLAKKYEVAYQHTFVQVDENGNMIAKWSGGSMDEVINNIK